MITTTIFGTTARPSFHPSEETVTVHGRPEVDVRLSLDAALVCHSACSTSAFESGKWLLDEGE